MRLNMNMIKIIRYGFIAIVIAAALGAYYYHHHGNNLLALKLLTTATLFTGASLRPEIYATKSSAKFFIGFIIIMSILIALSLFRTYHRDLLFNTIAPFMRRILGR